MNTLSVPEIYSQEKQGFPIPTTCELYHNVGSAKLSLSVQSALFCYLHHVTKPPHVKRWPVETIQKNLKYVTRFAYQSFSKKAIIKKNKVDILFNYFSPSNHCLGVQINSASQCLKSGLRTGVISSKQIPKLPEFSHQFHLSEGVISWGSFIPRSKLNKIEDECHEASIILSQQVELGHFSEISSHLVRLATRIEEKASILQHFLEAISPELVVLVHGKMLEDTAMEIACKTIGIPTALIPHGFLQKSYSPLSASYIMSYCPHHDGYLKELSSPENKIIPLGWLEPSVSLGSNKTRSAHRDSFVHSSDKYNILFLSSISGWEIHRCPSLVKRVPEVLKALEEMPEVENIRVRLRPDEAKNLLIQTLLDISGASKLEISVNQPIEDDLSRCNTLMSFNSTGVLYGPYLNMRAIEIRDKAINSVWGNSVLPNQQVYQVEGEFDSRDFKDFVVNSPTLLGEKVFYNWKNELSEFSRFISSNF
jgi:hypothetical protein